MKGKKSKKAKNESKPKLTKKTITTLIISLAVVLVITAAIITTVVIKKKINDRTVRIGFYGLSEDMCALIQKQIPQEEPPGEPALLPSWLRTFCSGSLQGTSS